MMVEESDVLHSWKVQLCDSRHREGSVCVVRCVVGRILELDWSAAGPSESDRLAGWLAERHAVGVLSTRPKP